MLSTNLSSRISAKAYNRDIFTLLSLFLSFVVQVGKKASRTFVHRGPPAGWDVSLRAA